MYFVLPGKDGHPVETLRYETLRMAVQDYELLRIATESLSEADAQALFTRAFGCILKAGSLADFARVSELKAEALYSLAPDDYHRARKIIVTELAK